MFLLNGTDVCPSAVLLKQPRFFAGRKMGVANTQSQFRENHLVESQNPIKAILSFAGECKGKMTLSVVFAIISVAGGIVPYFGVYQIIVLFFRGEPAARSILFWGAVCAAGYIVKILFYGIAMSLSHRCAYKILENIRLAIAGRLMRAPLGVTLGKTAGSLKSTIVDKVETLELPLAHIIPEGISNLILPVAVFAYMLAIDWRMALAAFAGVPIGAAAYAVVMKTFGEKYEEQTQAGNRANSVIVEYVEGIEVIKMFGRSGSSYEKFTAAINDLKTFTLAWFKGTSKLMNFADAVMASTLLGILPVGMLLFAQGAIAPAELVMCIILSMGIITRTWNMRSRARANC